MKKLDGQVAIITGGASGIGEATVRLFAEQGARVVISDIDDQRGEALARELGKAGMFLHTDVSMEADVRAAVNQAIHTFGRLDCLFNNAGVISEMPRSIADMPVDGYERIMSVSVCGVFLGIKHAAPVMKRQGGGSIINTASIAGLRAGNGSHLYSAAKAAVIQLTRSVAVELGECGVRVNCICPGAVLTPFWNKAFGVSDDQAKEVSDQVKDALARIQPIHRACLPEDVAQAVLWLASDSARFVNGHALVVDGGTTGGRMWSVVKAATKEIKAGLGLSG